MSCNGFDMHVLLYMNIYIYMYCIFIFTVYINIFIDGATPLQENFYSMCTVPPLLCLLASFNIS